jgi:hypothetical protein
MAPPPAVRLSCRRCLSPDLRSSKSRCWAAAAVGDGPAAPVSLSQLSMAVWLKLSVSTGTLV